MLFSALLPSLEAKNLEKPFVFSGFWTRRAQNSPRQFPSLEPKNLQKSLAFSKSFFVIGIRGEGGMQTNLFGVFFRVLQPCFRKSFFVISIGGGEAFSAFVRSSSKS